jgi:hypothetical protein
VPKVVIELQANTQAAVAQIQQFARAQKDAFDAVRAGNPALVDSQVKISKLTDAKKAATSAAQTWGSALQQLPGPLGGITSQVQSLAGMMTGPAGIATAMTAAGVAALGLVNNFADSIERLDNLSAATGLAVSSLQAFEQAAIEAGESPDALIAGLGKVNVAINDVLTGTKDAGKAFEAIGVPINQMVKDGASAEQILEATAKALANIEDKTERAARQWEIFTAKGKAMGILMDTLAHESIEDYINRMREAGIVTSDEANRMARDFDKGMDSMKRSMKAAATSMAVDILGLIDVAKKSWTQITNIFTMGAAAAGKAAADAMAAAGERPPPQDIGTGGKPRTIATPGPSEADIKKAEEAYDRIAVAALKSTGRTLEAIELERTQRNKAMDEELAAAEKKYMELLKLPGKAEEAAKLRLAAEQKYQNEGLVSEQKYADDRAAILNKWAEDAIGIMGKLGPAFEKATNALKLDKFMGDTGKSIQVLENLKASLGDTHPAAAKLGEAIVKLQKQMVEAAQKGFPPVTEEAKKTTAAMKETSTAAEQMDMWFKADAFTIGTLTSAAKAASAELIQVGIAVPVHAFSGLHQELGAGTERLYHYNKQIEQTDVELTDVTETLGTASEASANWTHEINSLNAEMAAMDSVIYTAEHGAQNLQDRMLGVTDETRKAADAFNKTADAAKMMASSVRDAAQSNTVYTASLAGVVGGTGPGGMITAMDILGGRLRAGPAFFETKRFQFGGIVPGSGPVPIIAHGGERILTKAQQQAGGFGAVTINITQAPTQDPQALVRALMPTLRAEMARGTV